MCALAFYGRRHAPIARRLLAVQLFATLAVCTKDQVMVCLSCRPCTWRSSVRGSFAVTKEAAGGPGRRPAIGRAILVAVGCLPWP
jgi:hypothetical protein